MNKFLLKYNYDNGEQNFNYYQHECGLELLFVKTSDENNTFCAKFDTLPKNDRGIPHILEHIILCGSDKYPIDDPFNELVKGTLFTYLNAITYCDKTIYPVASKNKSEFKKMYEVYLDAIFSPLLLKEAFLKEGVRKTKNGYSGVVFNEMSSVYNDVENIISYHMNKELLTGTDYAFDAGGYPLQIMNATHEDVKSFYEKNYHKSKAFLYFYGDLDIDEILEYIHENYLKDEPNKNVNLKRQLSCNYTKKIVNKTICLDKKLDINYYCITYSIDRNYNNNNYFLDELCILFDFLLESDTSLLTEFLKYKYDLIDISYDFETDTKYPCLIIILKSENKIENSFNVREDINRFLKKQIDIKFDKNEILALVNLTKFKYIDENFGYKSKGLSYFIEILSFYQYNCKRDYIHLSKNLDFDCLSNKIIDNYFESLVEDVLINCENSIFVEFIEGDSEKDLNIAKDDDEFLQLDSLEYSDKYIKTVDFNEISDFNEIEFEEEKICGKDVYFTRNESEEITYLTLAFKVHDDFENIGIYIALLGETRTKNKSKREVKICLDKNIGDLNISFESIKSKSSDVENYVIFEVKILNEYLEEAFKAIEEIINESMFDDFDLNKSKINEMILDFDEDIVSDNIRLGLLYANKNLNDRFYNKDLIDGFGFYKNLLNFKNRAFYDFSTLNNSRNIFYDLKIFVCSYEYTKVRKHISSFINNINLSKDKLFITNEKKDIVLKTFMNIDSTTYTNIRVGNVDKIKYNGVCEVFSSIIKNEYFSDEIRIKGGAYGYDFSFDYDMNFYMYSMDDPNYSRTFKVFDNTSKYIINKSLTDRDIKNHIIGAINSFDNFRSFYEKYYLFVLSKLKNVENGFYNTVKEEILYTNSIKLSDFAVEFNENLMKIYNFSFGNKNA